MLGLRYTGVCVYVSLGPPEAEPETKISEKAVDLGGDSFEYWGSEMRKEGC